MDRCGEDFAKLSLENSSGGLFSGLSNRFPMPASGERPRLESPYIAGGAFFASAGPRIRRGPGGAAGDGVSSKRLFTRSSPGPLFMRAPTFLCFLGVSFLLEGRRTARGELGDLCATEDCGMILANRRGGDRLGRADHANFDFSF